MLITPADILLESAHVHLCKSSHSDVREISRICAVLVKKGVLSSSVPRFTQYLCCKKLKPSQIASVAKSQNSHWCACEAMRTV